VTELVARTADLIEPRRRPGFFRVWLLTILGGGFGALAAVLASVVVEVAGVASLPLWDRSVPYLPTGGGPIAADALGVLYVTSFSVLVTRWLLRAWVEEPPAWTWIAATLVPAAGVAAVSPRISDAGAWVIAGVALRYVAWDAEGHARPEPIRSVLALRLVKVLTPALLLAAITAYAMFHPLSLFTSTPATIRPGTSPVLVNMLSISNDGGRPVRILSIEPGRERGYALHLIGVRTYYEGARPFGAPETRPFTPFVLRPHEDTDPPTLALQLSRAGCRPGTSGRIDTVRVRYALGGVHTMELKLDPAPALSC
jgi:hypothetical protein